MMLSKTFTVFGYRFALKQNKKLSKLIKWFSKYFTNPMAHYHSGQSLIKREYLYRHDRIELTFNKPKFLLKMANDTIKRFLNDYQGNN